MRRALRIAVTADPEIPVPPVHYGGIERIIGLLVDGLSRAGHEVTLFAHADSRVSCRLVPYRQKGSLDAVRNASLIAAHKRDFDVIHSFGRLAYLLPLLPRPIPKLMSYQREISPRSVVWGIRLAGGTLQFSACSRKMTEPVMRLGRWHVVYNSVNLDQYTFRSRVDSDAPLVFLGRVEHIKGPHLTIEAARRSGRRLIIAGNVPEAHREYFDSRILPHVDGDRVRYAGAVDDAQKNELLGQAAALLMPVLWEEPFGIVMAEALACGTPVIGLRRGSVPEVIEDGRNGFICDDSGQMVEAIAKLPELDRSDCRRTAEERFSSKVMVAEYLRVYSSMLAQRRRAA